VVSGSTGKTIGVNVEDDDSLIDNYVSPLSTQILPNIVGEEEVTTFMPIVMIMMKEN